MNPVPTEEALFEAARQLPAAAQHAFLDQACAGNIPLRERLQSLLADAAAAENFFAAVVPFGAATNLSREKSGAAAEKLTVDWLAEYPASRIGPYKLLQRIGEGGGGAVYMADQEQPVRRRVALKVIKLGMDTKNVIARFEAERQALAMMDHPNIARVLDAGATETGRPYFVMELVRGVRITDYCDQHQLDTRQRLDLFIQICRAIQHAHQKGIIHRDIKPSNILVTLHDGKPVPKVIDFGIAKATDTRLTDKTLFTGFEQIVGTPAYMSPEQAEINSLDVDTRSDIYSLGVLLYELLTGKTPFDGKELVSSGLDEMRRTLRQKEPQRPSTMLTTLQNVELTATAKQRDAEAPKLISLLRGDLDWIVMKALEKDRTRRYETANGLAMDIERYLHNEPVIARPPSRVYRFQKLVRRNKVVFAATGAVIVALVAGFGTSTWLFLKEREARERAVEAERQQERLRQAADTREKITHATVLVSQEKFEEAEALVAGINFEQPTVEGAAALRALGEWRALQNDWTPAARHFKKLLQVDQLDGVDVCTLDYLECGPALIESGDTEGYARFRQEAIERFASKPYPFADRIIKISLLLPVEAALLKTIEPMAEASVASFDNGTNSEVFLAAWRSVSLALWEYRRGHFDETVAWCQRCLAYSEHIAPRSAAAQVLLAMADWNLHHRAQARAELAEVQTAIENHFKSGLDRGTGVEGFWFDWVFCRLLLTEAGALIGKSP